MSQIPLSLSLPLVYSEDNFFLSDCNREAHHAVMRWPHWQAHAMLLYGPKGSGKTHLGRLWTHRTHGFTLQAAELATIEYPLASHALVENIERTCDERLLLHLINHTRDQELNLLLTSSVMPPHLPFTLPDLTSRLLAMPCVSIAQPDDAVLAAAMRKQFSDRQMKVSDDVIAYALPRMERSLAKVAEMVERVDHSALAERKNVTIPFIRKFLEERK